MDDQIPHVDSDHVDNITDVDDVVIEAEEETLNPAEAVKKLREKLKKAVAEKQEYLDGWQRHRADFLNFKKRTDEELKGAGEAGKAEVLHDLAAVVESFDLAFANKEAWEKVDKNWRTGVEYIHTQLLSTLENHGMKSYSPPEGTPYDGASHIAVETVPTSDESKDHTIASVIQKGSMIGKTIIRPPKVRVYAYTKPG